MDSLLADEPLVARSFGFGGFHSAARALDRVADHRAPLLTRRAVEVLSQRPAPAVRAGGPLGDGATKVIRGTAFEVRPARSDQRGVMRVARSRLGGAHDVRVQPGCSARAHAARV